MLITNNKKLSWLWLIYGIIALVLGVLIIANPFSSFMVLSIIIGCSLILFGLILFFLFIKLRKNNTQANFLLAEALFNLVLGLLILITGISGPGFLLLYIAFWITLAGCLKISNAMAISKIVKDWWWSLAVGIIMLLFGIFALIFPYFFASAYMVIAGVIVLVSGIWALTLFVCSLLSKKTG